jgi:hypothetical protein
MHNMATLCIRLQPLWLSYKIQKNRAVGGGDIRAIVPFQTSNEPIGEACGLALSQLNTIINKTLQKSN